ncbi:helix-turn-helix domain-containing protein [Streptomyces sp. NPDC093707]|uniref:PucR family transcriptional regulator n=1 Tax=Streptomyces sp. NPDC093707 TaxID=3154984 RepID=UPI00344FB96C
MSTVSVCSDAELLKEACGPKVAPGAQDFGTPWIDRLCDEITCEITKDVFPTRQGNVPFHNGLRRFVRTNVLSVAKAHNVAPPPAEDVTSQVRDFGAWVAEQGFSLVCIRQAYWTGTRELIDRWGRMGWPGLAPDPAANGGRIAVSGEMVSRVAFCAFDFAERAMRESVLAHQEATAGLRLGGDLRRRDVITTILATDDGRVNPAWDAALGYRLGGTHIGLLINATDRAHAEQVLQRAKTATSAREHLLLPPLATHWTAWLGYRKAVSVGVLDTLRRTLLASDAQTAMGRPRPGIAGFRASHREAVRAEDIREKFHDAPRCLSFHDLSLEDLLLHDPPSAATFVRDELGPLADSTDRAARMRETLSVWLSCGTHTATAARLSIHENTVRLRLNAVTEMLGAGYLGRKAELLVALRLCDVLAAPRP